MDQVRAILKIVWRERFWVLSVVGILVAVVCWQLSSSALDKEFVSRKGEIEGKFKEMNTLASETPHPNDKVIEGNQAQAREQSENVLKVWQKLYDRQRKEVLFWPKDSLKPQFIEAIEKLKFRDPFPVQLAEDMRTHYWNYIGSRFDGLLKIVKALKSDERGRFSGGDRGEGMEMEGEFGAPRSTFATNDGEPVDEDYLVLWLDQSSLREKLQFKTKPSAVEIWVTQEDLWVYESLLNVIANTNKGATRPDNAAVRVIESLQVGRAAAAASRQKASILMPQVAAGVEGMEGGESEYSERSEYPEGGYEEAPMREGDFAEGEGVGSSDTAVLANRYLDPEGKPYPGEPEDKEYRRLPVRMRLLMDQRFLPKLLVECANAALPVEVKQVRVNPDQSGVGFGGTARASSRNAFKGTRGGEDDVEDPNLADVEIRGVVFIYNQPDETIFESLVSDEDQLADASGGE